MTPYHKALFQCATRYDEMLTNDAPSDDTLPSNTLRAFVIEFGKGCVTGLPIPKLCRWLGYIQGVLIERGYTTVTAERDWTRPLFRPLDFA